MTQLYPSNKRNNNSELDLENSKAMMTGLEDNLLNADKLAAQTRAAANMAYKFMNMPDIYNTDTARKITINNGIVNYDRGIDDIMANKRIRKYNNISQSHTETTPDESQDKYNSSFFPDLAKKLASQTPKQNLTSGLEYTPSTTAPLPSGSPPVSGTTPVGMDYVTAINNAGTIEDREKLKAAQLAAKPKAGENLLDAKKKEAALTKLAKEIYDARRTIHTNNVDHGYEELMDPTNTPDQQAKGQKDMMDQQSNLDTFDEASKAPAPNIANVVAKNIANSTTNSNSQSESGTNSVTVNSDPRTIINQQTGRTDYQGYDADALGYMEAQENIGAAASGASSLNGYQNAYSVALAEQLKSIMEYDKNRVGDGSKYGTGKGNDGSIQRTYQYNKFDKATNSGGSGKTPDPNAPKFNMILTSGGLVPLEYKGRDLWHANAAIQGTSTYFNGDASTVVNRLNALKALISDIDENGNSGNKGKLALVAGQLQPGQSWRLDPAKVGKSGKNYKNTDISKIRLYTDGSGQFRIDLDDNTDIDGSLARLLGVEGK